MELNENVIKQIKNIYSIKKIDILSRLKEFKNLWLKKSDEEIFTELAFCILTPQSKAKFCWDALVKLRDHDLLLKGDAEQIKQGLNCVRFKNKKALYIVKARKQFTNDGKISLKLLISSFSDISECREWLVQNIAGLGYKEAS